LFEAADESGFDFECDVAVDLDQPVGEVVAESFGLGDFGNVISDEPRLVTVPQPMERQARPDRVQAMVGVAIDGWPEDPAVEVLRRSRHPWGLVNTNEPGATSR
jgi:hypothetical protein